MDKPEVLGASLRDRATLASPQAPTGLGHSESVPSAWLGPQSLFPEAGCDLCQGDYPMYGVAPHECYWRKGPQFMIGQSTLLPIGEWVELFVPDLDDGETWADFSYPSACGTFYCPHCQQDRYAAAWEGLVSRIGEPPAVGRDQ